MKNQAAVALGQIKSKKKGIQARKNGKMGGRLPKDYEALLTIVEMPKTKESQDRLIWWLGEKIEEIRTADPHAYASPCRFRLMK